MKKMVLLAGVLFCCALLSNAGEIFQSRFRGFSINRPAGWPELDTNYAHKKIKEYDFTEKQLTEIFEPEHQGMQLPALSKQDPRTNAGVIPTIKINATPVNITDQEAFLQSVRQHFNSILKVPDHARFEKEFAPVQLNGVPVVAGIISYDLKNEGHTYRARTFIYSVL